MTVEEIIEALTPYTGDFPKSAVMAAMAHKEEILPRLLQILEDVGFCKVICVNGFCFGFCCCDFPCIRHEIKRAGGEL